MATINRIQKSSDGVSVPHLADSTILDNGTNIEVDGNVTVHKNNWYPGQEATVVLGDPNHYIKAIHNEGVRIGTYGAPDLITIKQVSGVVGIGTTAPTERLEVDGNIKLTDYVHDRVWTTEKVFNVLDFGAIPLSLRSGSTGTSGSIVASYSRITEVGKFTNASVGDILWVHNGINTGYYVISSKINNDTVQVSSSPHGFYGDQHNVNWKVTAGSPSSVDATQKFQDAIDAANAAGGGVVFVPTGYYFFSGTVTVKSNVIVRGMWSEPHTWEKVFWQSNTPQGPVLLPTAGKGSVSGPAFITLDGAGTACNAMLEGLTIFYPEQRITGGSTTLNVTVEQYPFCINLRSDYRSDNAVAKMLLVNAYQGISVTSVTFQGRCTISHIYGCLLKKGLEVDYVDDTSYIENIRFSPYYFLGNPSLEQEQKDWLTYVVKELTVIRINGAVWSVLNNIQAYLGNRGLVIGTAATQEITSGDIIGHNIQFDQMDVPLEMINGYAILNNFKATAGRSPADWSIVNDMAVWDTKNVIRAENNGNWPLLRIVNGNMGTFGTRVVDWQTNGALDIANSNFVIPLAPVAEGVYATGGYVSVQNSRFYRGSYGYTQCVVITSGALTGIVSGNDYLGNPAGSNAAANNTFNVTGSLGVGVASATKKLEVKGDALISGDNWGSGEDAVVNLGDANHYIKSVWGDGVRIGTCGVGDAVTIKQTSGNVGIGTTSPASKLDVKGSIGFSEIKTVTANYSLTDEDYVILINSSDFLTITLPLSANRRGRMYIIKSIGGAVEFYLQATSPNKIDNANKYAIRRFGILYNQGCTIICDGTNWWIQEVAGQAISM